MEEKKVLVILRAVTVSQVSLPGMELEPKRRRSLEVPFSGEIETSVVGLVVGLGSGGDGVRHGVPRA